MEITLKYNKELQLEDNNDIKLTIEEERKYRDYIFLAKKEYERLKGDIYNKFKKEYKGDFETFAEYINNHCNSGEAEILVSEFDSILLPFHLNGDYTSIDGVITSYGIMIDPNIVYYNGNNIYCINVKENTIQIEI